MSSFQPPSLPLLHVSALMESFHHEDILNESMREQMEIMFWQEARHYRTTDYLATINSSVVGVCADQDSFMSEQWRTRMCEWAYQLIDHFELPRNVVGTCTNLLDRYLAKHFSVASANGLPVIEKKEFQLVTMSCLYLAMKAKGENRVPIEYMVQLSRGTMDKCQLEGMEMQLLTKLAWMVNPPTAFDFAEHYLHLLRPSYRNGCVQMTALLNSSKMKALVDQTAFLVELSVLDYYFVSFRPSTVALAALFNAMDEDPEVTARSRNPFSMYKNCHGFEGMILPGEEGNVFLCRQRLDSLYRNSAAGGDDQFEPESPRAATTASKSDRMTSPVSVVATLQS